MPKELDADKDAEVAEDDHWLNDVWTFHFHDPDDQRWTLDSYRRLGDATSVEEFWELQDAIAPHVRTGMFFMMREHVFPCWDDKHNIDGGCLSLKLTAEESPAAWELLLKRAIGETLVRDDASAAALNGISISPKRGFCIVKIWLADDKHVTRAHLRLPDAYRGELVFRSNRENMQNFHTGVSFLDGGKPPPEKKLGASGGAYPARGQGEC